MHSLVLANSMLSIAVYAATELVAATKEISWYMVDYNNTLGITKIPILKKVGSGLLRLKNFN